MFTTFIGSYTNSEITGSVVVLKILCIPLTCFERWTRMSDVLADQIDEQLDELFDGARELTETVISNIVRELYTHWYINSERVVTDALKVRLLSIVTGVEDNEDDAYDY